MLLGQEPADAPDIHPNICAIYRRKVKRPAQVLNAPQDKAQAYSPLRAPVDKIADARRANRGEIDATLSGELGASLA